MFALISLMVCLAAQPVVCETVTPDYVYSDMGRSPTFFECLGPVGQDIARHWLARIQATFCAASNARSLPIRSTSATAWKAPEPDPSRTAR